jgi:hypothetical protein
MGKPLGPTFGDECIAAGLGGLPFSWGATSDDMITDQLTADQRGVLQTVIDAHDPTKQPAPQPTPADQVLYDHENRLRNIEGVPPLTLGEFLTKAKL